MIVDVFFRALCGLTQVWWVHDDHWQKSLAVLGGFGTGSLVIWEWTLRVGDSDPLINVRTGKSSLVKSRKYTTKQCGLFCLVLLGFAVQKPTNNPDSLKGTSKITTCTILSNYTTCTKQASFSCLTLLSPGDEALGQHLSGEGRGGVVYPGAD